MTDYKAMQWDHPNRYAQFLSLDTLLSLQQPQWADKHDEVMFVVVHQISELWIKLALHEINLLRELIRAGDLEPCEPVFERLRRIQTQLIASWDVTVTLEPVKYLEFRETQGFHGSSGFQSYQYRMLEFMLGNKKPELAEMHVQDVRVHAQLLAALHAPSLYDESLRLLHREGLDLPPSTVERDWSRAYVPSPEVERAWLKIYREYRERRSLYRLAEHLVDIEYQFQKWRFTHLKTVERLIGSRPGTGGSPGVGYLAQVLNITFFPELWSIRSHFREPADSR